MATKVKLIETGAVTGNIIPDGGIATGKLANDAVTTIKISDANITHAKLHTSMDLTGKTVTVATAAGSTNTTAAASTAFVQQELTTLIGGAPSTLNDLNELAAAINDDDNYNSTLTTALATKLPLAGGTLTGALTSNSLIKTTGDLEIASTQPRIMLDRSNGSYTWNIYNGDGSGNFPQSTFNIANNAGTSVLTALDSGNVGIGVTNPGQVLEIHNSNASDYTDFALRGTGHKYVIGVGNASVATVNDKWYLYDNDNSAFRMVVDTSGNVGIGETSPNRRVVVKSADNVTNSIQFQSPTTGNAAGDGVGVGMDSTRKAFLWNYEGNDIYLGGATSSTAMTILGSGNVGIGTTNPAQNFVVAAATNGIGIELVPGTLNYIQAYNRGTSDYSDLKIDSQSIRFGTDNGTERARISSTGRFHLNHTNDPGWDSLGTLVVRQIADDIGIGVVDANSQNTFKMLNNETYAELNYNVNLPIIFTTGTGGGTERMRIHTGGDVLVGGTSTNLNVLAGTPKIQVGDGTGHSSIQFYSNFDAVGALYFGDATSGIQRYNGYIEYRHSGDTMAFRANGAQKLLLGNDVTTFNDPIETTTDTGTRMYTGLATGSHYQSTGYLILDTTIPDPGQSGANMFSIHINGYSYNNTLGGIIDLNIGAYSGEGYFHNPSYSGSNIPDKWVNNVRFARKSSTNTVSIILGDSGTVQPIEIAATLFIQGFGSTNASYAKGWDWKTATSTTGYTQLTKVNEKTTKRPSFGAGSSGFSVASGWQIISDSMSQTHDGPDDDYNPSNGRFTPQLPGWYQFNFGGWATYSSSTGQERYAIAFAKNGSTTYLAGGNYSAGDSPLAGASKRVYLNGSSDYVELKAYSSVATQWGGSSHWVWWEGYWTGS